LLKGVKRFEGAYMIAIPKFIEENKTLRQPFYPDGTPTLITSILATLLPDEPLKKEALLGKIDEQHAGKTRGYLSNHFSELSRLDIIKFTKRFGTWSQGSKYKEYMSFVFATMVFGDPKAAASLQYHLMPKKDEQSVDFIVSPDEDIFSQPNAYLED